MNKDNHLIYEGYKKVVNPVLTENDDEPVPIDDEDKPTEIWPKTAGRPDEIQVWRNKKGQYHRETGPAWIDKHGNKHWYLDGEMYSAQGWAKRVLERQGKPATPEAVESLLRSLHAKANTTERYRTWSKNEFKRPFTPPPQPRR